MTISLNTSNVVSTTTTVFSSSTADTSQLNTSTPGAISPQNARAGIQPAPIVKVNESGRLESPYVKITQELSDNANRKLPATQPAISTSKTSTSKLIQNIVQQQQAVEVRRESLEKEQSVIESEINKLQKQELELNRKKFQIQQQKSIGDTINLKS